MRLFHVLPLLLLCLFSGCAGRNGAEDNANADSYSAAESREANGEKERAIRLTASRIAAALDDRQLAAQVIITGIDGRGQLPRHMRALLEECPAGGIMLFRYNLDTDNDAIQNLIAETSEIVSSGAAVELENGEGCAIPPFIAADHEGGFVNRFLPGVADLPPASAYWEMSQGKGAESAIIQIHADSFDAGTAVYDLGVNLNLAPVAEYLHELNRDFLEDRSYGPDPAFTAKAAAAFIMGMESAGVLCAAKHFPGSAGADPHLYPSELPGDKAALDNLASPFAALIREGHARALMVSHTAVPAWDSENISSLSPAVMGGWLREELGYKGIVITDDFSMAAGSQGGLLPELAAVQSLAAGADMILVWQPDLMQTHRAILAALNEGGLSRERLKEAAERIIFEKLWMGLIRE